MAKLRFTIHPLFFLFGLYFALTGRIFVFITYTIVAVIHEIGHSIAAARLGYKLSRIVLMPYGAVVYGNIRGLSFADEIRVALAGPATNLACAVFFAALWWIAPESYAYTDLAMTASLSIATVNLLPCRPLDGGRVLHAFLSSHLSEKLADTILLVSGVVFSCVLGGIFVISCFYTINFSLLFFALFAFFGTVFAGKKNRYVRIYESYFGGAMERGAEVKRIAVTGDVTVKRLVSMLDTRTLTEVCVCSNEGKTLKVLSPREVCTIASGSNLYLKLSEVI